MLPQKPASRPRNMTLQRLVAWSAVPMLGVVGAFGVMPQTIGSSMTSGVQVQHIALPQIQPTGGATTFWHYDEVQRGDSLPALLQRLDVNDDAATRYLRRARAAAQFRRMKPGMAVLAETNTEGNLVTLRYAKDDGSQVQLERSGGAFAVHAVPAKLEQRIFMRTGEIRTTLFEATDAAGLPESVANQLTDIFGTQIDFHHDLRPGDSFSVIYDVSFSNGEPVRVGRILGAEFINRGRMYRALYYNPGNSGNYFSPEGNSLRGTFLRAPVAYTRISSGYTAARYHPILHMWKAHRGIDFAAPTGTPVEATADGKVVYVGWKMGYGKVVILKHRGSFSTLYGHLSRFTDGLQAGRRVEQGEVIAYVGMTGWATGPHLHYEFRVDGTPRDPAKVPLPDDNMPISNAQRQAFLDATQELNGRLRILHNINLALAE